MTVTIQDTIDYVISGKAGRPTVPASLAALDTRFGRQAVSQALIRLHHWFIASGVEGLAERSNIDGWHDTQVYVAVLSVVLPDSPDWARLVGLTGHTLHLRPGLPAADLEAVRDRIRTANQPYHSPPLIRATNSRHA